MKLEYSVTGAERKKLVGAMSNALHTESRYLGVPSFAYEVGGYTISKDGTVTGEDNPVLVGVLRDSYGFTATSEEYDTPITTGHGESTIAPTELSTSELLANEQPIQKQEPNNKDSSEESEDLGLTIEIPLDGFTPEKLENLNRLVTAKSELLKLALGIDSLPIQLTETTLRFPWFTHNQDHAQTLANVALVSRLCATAKDKKRITAKEKGIDSNPKYAMRCFLLSLGFIGAEYKTARKTLLARLDGNSSWKRGIPKDWQERHGRQSNPNVQPSETSQSESSTSPKVEPITPQHGEQSVQSSETEDKRMENKRMEGNSYGN